MSKIKIIGLDCPNCAKKLENRLNKSPYINKAEINFLKSYIYFESDNEEKAIKEIVKITHELEPDAKIILNDEKSKSLLLDITMLVIGIILSIITLFIVKIPSFLYWGLFVISALLMGYKTFIKALKLLFKGIINENLLITISIIGATVVGEHMEGLMVIGLYSIGKILENIALNKSKKSIEELTDFKPEYAIVLRDEKEIKIDPSQVEIGDILLIKAGERVAVDGVVTKGKATLDLQSLTGESIPVIVNENEEILSGSVVSEGILQIKASKKYEQSTVNTILNLIENASDKKSKTETFISKASKYYTLGVIFLAIVVFFVVFLLTKNFDTSLYRGLIFLVVSCPCAFAISVPLTYFSGLGNASKQGILIKGSNYLDACAKLNLIAFDKTGTITSGEFKIVNIITKTDKYNEKEILYLAALGEQYSLHPIAISIVNENKKKLKEVTEIREIIGEGVYYTYNNHEYFVGRKSKKHNSTTIELYEENIQIGEIYLEDTVKSNANIVINVLKKLNVKTTILSGDNEKVVLNVAEKVGVDSAYSRLLPKDKYDWIENNKKDNYIGYVGDGLNDAPSLTLANVGFCMGLKGNVASIEASDIVISNDNLEKIPLAINISRYTRKIVWENIIFALSVKIIFLSLGTLGITGMLSAVIADVGVTVISILNSLRALNYKK